MLAARLLLSLLLLAAACGDPARDLSVESDGERDAPAEDAVRDEADDVAPDEATEVVEVADAPDDGALTEPTDAPEADDTSPDLPEGTDRDCFAPLEPPRWSTCAGALHDPLGRRARLRGVNVSNARKHPPYEGGTSVAEIAAMRAHGLDHVRLLWSWAAAMPERGVLDEAYLERLAAEVERFGDAGLLVLVDSHQDLFGEAIRTAQGPLGNGAPAWACPEEIATVIETPLTPWFANYSQDAVIGCFDHLLADEALQGDFAAAWRAVASRVAALDNVLGYDLWNEPFWGSHNLARWEEEQLLPLYERLGTAILEVDPDALLFVEPGVQKNALGTSNLPRPSFPEVIYAPHLYDLALESGEEWSGSTAALRRRLSIDRAEAVELGAPLYHGEWGTPGLYPSDAAFVAAVDALLDTAGVGWAIWQWGPGGPGSYALVDATLTWSPHAEGLARPWLARVAGDAASLTWDAESGAAEAAWTARRDDVPTVIVVPASRYVVRPEVAVEGGTMLEGTDEDRVEVLADAVGSRVRVTLLP
jgi:endoglycosylceramidase